MTTGKAKSSQMFLKQLADFMKYCETKATQDTDGEKPEWQDTDGEQPE